MDFLHGSAAIRDALDIRPEKPAFHISSIRPDIKYGIRISTRSDIRPNMQLDLFFLTEARNFQLMEKAIIKFFSWKYHMIQVRKISEYSESGFEISVKFFSLFLMVGSACCL